jgi:hypothetical protein
LLPTKKDTYFLDVFFTSQQSGQIVNRAAGFKFEKCVVGW